MASDSRSASSASDWLARSSEGVSGDSQRPFRYILHSRCHVL